MPCGSRRQPARPFAEPRGQRRRLRGAEDALEVAASAAREPEEEPEAPDWLDRMLARKPVKVVTVALAARMARTVWALIARGESYRAVPG